MRPFIFIVFVLSILISCKEVSYGQTKGWTCLKTAQGDTAKPDAAISNIIKGIDGSIYIAGSFKVRDTTLCCVVQWNDTAITQVGDPVAGIWSVCQDKAAHLYASVVGNNGRWSMMQLQNSTWQLLDTSMQFYYQIFSLCCDTAGNLYVSSITANPHPHGFIARWDGKVWTVIDSGSVLNGYTYSMCSDYAGNVYAAGLSGNGNNMYVAKWNGATWTVVGSGTNALNANDAIHALYCDRSNNVYAAGQFTDTTGYAYVAKWDGNSWQEVGIGANTLHANSYIKALYVDDQYNVYAGGFFMNSAQQCYVAKWDGSKWAALGSGIYGLDIQGGNNPSITTISQDGQGDIYTIGFFIGANNNGLNYIGRYGDVSFLGVNRTAGVENSVHVYPNPSYGEISIQQAGLPATSRYQIYSAEGKLAVCGNLSSTLTHVSIKDLPSGTYLLTVGNNQYAVKLLKQ